MLAIALLAASLLPGLLPGAVAAEPVNCTRVMYDAGLCAIGSSIADDEAILTGTAGAPGAPGSPAAGTPASASPADTASEPEPDPCASALIDPAVAAWCAVLDAIPTPATPAVTLTDIARFRPAPGQQRMEPDGWVVVGLPANIYAIANAQLVPGTLFGAPADVRFTPTGYRWDYGDGTSATLATPGASWAAQGLREFDATPTSHIYRAAGDFTVRLSIVYRAQYRIGGGGFTPIAGSITLPANELYITAGGAKTVLVDRDCTVSPAGPGC